MTDQRQRDLAAAREALGRLACYGPQRGPAFEIDAERIADALAAARREAEARLPPERFPIMDGPSVRWSVIAPHEQQAIVNHQQDLRKLASRGGLSSFEAWVVVNGWDMKRGMAAPPSECRDRWRAFVAESERVAGLAVEGDAVRKLLCHPAFRSIRNEPGAARLIVSTYGDRTTFIGDTMEQTATRALAWLAKEADHG